MKAIFISSLLLSTPLMAQQAPSATTQTWTSKAGTTLKATLRGVDAGNAIFDTGGGTIRQVPLDALGDEDRQRVMMMLPRLITSALATPSSTFSLAIGPWPSRVSVGLEAAAVQPVAQAPAGQGYTSAHFEIAADVALTPEAANNFAQVLESAHELMRLAPWGVLATGAKGGKFLISLHEGPSKMPAGDKTGASYDRASQTLHVTLEAAGLRRTTGGFMVDAAVHPRALMRELAKMFIDDVDELAPGWFAIGFPSFFERIPFRAGTFWTGMADAALAAEVTVAKKSPGSPADVLRMTIAEWNGQPSPALARQPRPAMRLVMPEQQEVRVPLSPGAVPSSSPMTYEGPEFNALEAASYDAFFLAWHFAIREPRRLGKFLQAVKSDKAAWNAYDTGLEQYRKDIAEFLKRPDVVKLPDGMFRYPASLTPPTPPKAPHEVEPNHIPFVHQPLLLDGRTEAQVASEMQKALLETGSKK